MTDADVPTDSPARVGYIGKRLGRFLIIAELGRGGMATVYRARDPELGRDVAIKVMHGFFAGRPELEARFRREANAVATIRHPSILNVFDFAPPAGEEPGYIVSELIEGPGLRAVCDARGGKLVPEVAAFVVARVAEALGAAHAAGIVHRDVKPDNVLIDRANQGARIILTDFGVAHMSGMDTMTATGAVLGSPAYMSPEQARSEDVSATSDVFSLGVTLYQLCTGHLPFSGKDPLAVITAILRAQFRRPSEIEPRVGPQLEQVILRCLHTAPAARYANGAEVAAALREATASVRQAAGFSDEGAALARFLNDGAAFEAELGPVIARVAADAAEEARRRGQTARALAEVGRALAYVPGDPAGRATLERIGSGERFRSWRARAAVVVAAALLAVGGGLVWRVAKRPGASEPRTGGAPPTPVVNAMAKAPTATSPVPAPGGGPAARAAGRATVDTAPIARAASAPGESKVPPGGAGTATSAAKMLALKPARARASRNAAPSFAAGPALGAQRAHAEPHPAVAAGTAAPPLAPPAGHSPPLDRSAASGRPGSELAGEPRVAVPAAVAAETPAPAPTDVRKASLVLRASYGFCEPSLDGQAPSLRANYNDLQPGRHDVYCTIPQGPKVHVTTYDLRPGAKASLVIVPGPEGRPIIGRTE